MEWFCHCYLYSTEVADTLKWTWRQNFIYMLTLLSKGVPTKLLKFFLLTFFHWPWPTNISANFRKNSKRPYWYTQGLGGNWFMKKTRSRKSRGTVPLRWTWRTPNNILKTFLIVFFHLPLVSTNKNRNGLNGILRGLGERGAWNKPEVENHVELSLLEHVGQEHIPYLIIVKRMSPMILSACS